MITLIHTKDLTAMEQVLLFGEKDSSNHQMIELTAEEARALVHFRLIPLDNQLNMISWCANQVKTNLKGA